MNKIWIVEMWNDEYNQWEPTVGIGLSRKEAVDECKKWKTNNPGSKFRVRKYVEAK